MKVRVSGTYEECERIASVLEQSMDMEVLSCSQWYPWIEKVREHVESQGVEFVRLVPAQTFEYLLMEKPIDTKKYGRHYGYAWPSMSMRWCTRHLKIEVSNLYLKKLRESTGEDIILCTGLAADEAKRIAKPLNQKDRHPLAEWGWTEDMCLGYCYGKGYDWHDPSIGKGLYDLFSRTSCWICPLGTVDNFRQLRRWYPDLWARIGELEAALREQRESENDRSLQSAWCYTPKRTWQDLDDRFAMEDMGIPPRKLDDFFPLEASE